MATISKNDDELLLLHQLYGALLRGKVLKEERAYVHQIGEMLHKRGGLPLMQRVLQHIYLAYEVTGGHERWLVGPRDDDMPMEPDWHPQEVSFAWDGVGGWRT